MAEYQYSVSGDFPNQAVAPTKLEREILASAITQDLNYIKTDGDVCVISFASAITQATLDSLVAAHDGVPYVCMQCQALDSENVGLTSSTVYVERNSMEMDNIDQGVYKVDWYIEASISNTLYYGSFQVLFDSTVVAEFYLPATADSGRYYSLSGIAFVEVTDTHTITLKAKVENPKITLSTRRVRIHAFKLGDLPVTPVPDLNPYKEVKLVL